MTHLLERSVREKKVFKADILSRWESDLPAGVGIPAPVGEKPPSDRRERAWQEDRTMGRAVISVFSDLAHFAGSCPVRCCILRGMDVRRSPANGSPSGTSS